MRFITAKNDLFSLFLSIMLKKELYHDVSFTALCCYIVEIKIFSRVTSCSVIQWLKKTKRKPLFEALEKMKEGMQQRNQKHLNLECPFENKKNCRNQCKCMFKCSIALFFCASELMLLGFISLLLTATSSLISNICIKSKFYEGNFTPCEKSEVEDSEQTGGNTEHDRKLLMIHILRHSLRRTMSEIPKNTCSEACYSFFHFHFYFFSSYNWYKLNALVMFDMDAELWTFCFLWRSRTAPQIYLCHGNNPCNL